MLSAEAPVEMTTAGSEKYVDYVAEGRQGELKKPHLLPSDSSVSAQAQRERPLLLSQLPAPFKSEFLHASCSPLECH